MNATRFYRDIDRACWASLTDDQRREYRTEAMWLHRVYRMRPSTAVGIIRRMVRVGSWK
jgi:hypothetical protein